jgi:hypothetical protein
MTDWGWSSSKSLAAHLGQEHYLSVLLQARAPSSPPSPLFSPLSSNKIYCTFSATQNIIGDIELKGTILFRRSCHRMAETWPQLKTGQSEHRALLVGNTQLLLVELGLDFFSPITCSSPEMPR